MYQNKKRGIIGIVITIILLIIIVILSNIQTNDLSFVESALGKLVMPIQNGMTYLKNALAGNDSFFTDINSLQEENQTFSNEVVNNINYEIVSENTSKNDTQNKENTVVENTKKQYSKDDKSKQKKETQPSKNTVSQTNNKKEKTTSSKPHNKDFLFIDGYTMENVSQAAQNYLKSSGYPGECIPLKDEEGVYLGMRVVFY